MNNARQCQPCTACCDGWVSMRISGVEVFPGKPCPHSTGTGCDDYEHRPEDPCRKFICGWAMQGSPLPDWMQPCRAGVIVLFGKMRWRQAPVDVAIPVGECIPERALDWLKRFAEERGRPLLYTEQIVVDGNFQKEQQVFVHGPAEFQQECGAAIKAGAKFW